MSAVTAQLLDVQQPNWYRTLRRGVDVIDGGLVSIGCAMLFLLMCLVVADVARRYLFNAPIAWSYEVIHNYLMPGLFFCAASHTLKAHAHVAVDILHNYVGRRARYWFAAVASLLAVPVFALTTWLAAQRTLDEFLTAAQASSGLAVPSWTLSIVLPIGFGLLTLRLALNALGYAATLATGREFEALPPVSGSEEDGE